jgi:hypothetical protein
MCQTEWEKDAARFEEASSPTAADWDAAAEYFASLPGAMPVPEDFPDVTPERVRQIVEECNGLPF